MEEFTDVLSVATIASVVARLTAEAAEWSPIPPDILTLPVDDPAAAARAALDRVEAELARARPGHNQGPPLDPAIVAEIRQQVRSALDAVDAGVAGKEAGGAAASKLKALAKFIADTAAKVVVGEQVKEWLPGARHLVAGLSDYMLQAATALARWIASLPPGPLL